MISAVITLSFQTIETLSGDNLLNLLKDPTKDHYDRVNLKERCKEKVEYPSWDFIVRLSDSSQIEDTLVIDPV